ncbi:helix-turn-helix domain-containing protein [Kushneria indalinina]|uniref:AraC family transcriptional regulator n=1 Tax=Kushneria indalinina DSM 14324 TaxID=1122140 RepID=A0A3D9DW76_9GAMM|nr:helix-turn-helix domain-containing protein [Kushneria indalinina]REC94996.1 AraC family transcriptional regulator [Kushneria indalinina DSM 14324]
MKIAFHECKDVTQHAAQLPGWQQEFDQIETGHFAGEIVDIVGPGVRLYREKANLGVSQSIHFPADQWHFVLPLNWSSNSLYRFDALTVLPSCEEFLSVAPADYDLLVLSIERQHHPWLERDEKKLRLLEVAPALLTRLKQEWRLLTEYSRYVEGTLPAVTQQAMLRQLQGGIELLLDTPSQRVTSDDSGNYRTRRYIVDRCHALTRLRPDAPPSLMELCGQLKISRRTLQYSFQSETGQTPIHYLRALRLNAVRRRLLQDPTVPLADAAAQHGFFHQSYFTREYRRLFLEPPSVTRQRLAG